MGRNEEIKEDTVVLILVKDIGSAVATVQDVNGVAGKLGARNAGHVEPRLRHLAGEEQWKTSLSPSSLTLAAWGLRPRDDKRLRILRHLCSRHFYRKYRKSP